MNAATETTDTPAEALTRLYSGQSIPRQAMRAVITQLVQGELSEAQIAGMLIALRLKGETAEELTGAAQALRAAATPFDSPAYLFADTCGSGGDGASTINISTAVAFVSAAAGLPVAKHGNRSVTSKCGSADVLEILGVKLEASPEISRRALDQTGVCFLFAPNYHPGLRHAGPARRALGVRTMMNILGPCVNPAGPQIQLMGVSESRFLVPVAETLQALGVARVLVVHGSGLDEIALHGPTEAVLVRDGAITPMQIKPEDAGFATAPLQALKGGAPEENAARLMALLEGRGSAEDMHAVALNAGALLMLADKAKDVREGAAIALDTLRSGKPAQVLKAFAEATRA
ncbi:MAG: anthranilate phosphoribosyltransferase [Hyphomonadaceae bacterium]|nr:anthranilate phosphoribosyltransferase [Hyphomonadaceae bacterium]